MELVLPELDATKSVTWSFHVDDSQKNLHDDIIIGRDLLLELKLDLFSPDQMIKGNGGAYEGCTALTKYPSDLCDYASIRNEE